MRNCITLINGEVITPFRQIDKGCLLIEREFIKEIGKVSELKIPILMPR